MGNTFRLLAGGVDAVESEFGDGRTPALRRRQHHGTGFSGSRQPASVESFPVRLVGRSWDSVATGWFNWMWRAKPRATVAISHGAGLAKPRNFNKFRGLVVAGIGFEPMTFRL